MMMTAFGFLLIMQRIIFLARASADRVTAHVLMTQTSAFADGSTTSQPAPIQARAMTSAS